MSNTITHEAFIETLQKRFGRWSGRGCDWCAYGLIGGPLGVEMPDGNVVPSFDIAEAAVA